MRLLKLSLSTGAVTELDVVQGRDGSLMKFGEGGIVFSYRALKTETTAVEEEIPNWTAEGRARAYSLPNMSKRYDVSLVCNSESPTNGAIPLLSVDESSHIIGAFATPSGEIGDCRVLSEIFIAKIRRQYCTNRMLFLLVEEYEDVISAANSSKLIKNVRAHLLMVSPSSVELEKPHESIPSTVDPADPPKISAP